MWLVRAGKGIIFRVYERKSDRVRSCEGAKGTINGPTLKELLPEIFEKGGDPAAIVEERGLGAVSDAGALEAFVDQAIAANPNVVEDYKAGKKAAAGFFVGQVMKLSKGKADPKIVGRLVAERLAKC